jgi:hypothetical protein
MPKHSDDVRKKLSLKPLEFEEALEGLLRTPPPKKKAPPKERRRRTKDRPPKA